MAITSAQVVCGATEAALNTANQRGMTLLVKNTHATDKLFVGPTGVSTSNGFSIAATTTATVNLKGGDVLFGIRGAAADITAEVLRT